MILFEVTAVLLVIWKSTGES